MRRPERSPFLLLAAGASLLACRGILGLTPPEGLGDAGTGDAGSGDAGTGDAQGGASDAAAEASPAESGGSDAAQEAAGPLAYWTFIDDFEEGNLGRWQQAVDPPDSGSLTVVDSGAYQGCCAMQAIVDPGAPSPFVYLLQGWADASTPLVDAGTIAVRAHVKVAALADNVGLVSVVQGGTSPVAYSDAVFAPKGAAEGWAVELLDPANPSLAGQVGPTLADGGPDDAWHCIELDVNVGASGQVALFVDPASAAAAPSALLASSTLAAGGWDSVQLGIPFSTGGSSASEITYDDVEIALFHDALPTVRIGCP